MEKKYCVYKDDDEILAIVIKNNFVNDGVEFFTPHNFSQQLAYMTHKVGKIIRPHFHVPAKREIQLTQEVLIIRRGKLKVLLFTKQQNLKYEFILETGDVILLAAGGHGFEVIEDVEMIEVKQGPYMGVEDKIYLEEKVEAACE